MGMTEDTRITINFDPDQYRYLKKKDNTSAHVRRLVESDMKGQDTDLVGLEVQIQTLEQQAQHAAEQEEMYQSRAEELRDLRNQMGEKESIKLSEAKKNLEDTPKEPNNPAIQRWAEKLSLTPRELCQELNHT